MEAGSAFAEPVGSASAGQTLSHASWCGSVLSLVLTHTSSKPMQLLQVDGAVRKGRRKVSYRRREASRNAALVTINTGTGERRRQYPDGVRKAAMRKAKGIEGHQCLHSDVT